MPAEIDRGIRLLARGQLELLQEKSLEAPDRSLILGQALAWAVLETEKYLSDPFFAKTPVDFGRLKHLQSWIHDVMIRSHHEKVFRDILAYYDATMTLNSRDEIYEALNQLDPDLQKRIEGKDFGLYPDSNQNWLQTGRMLAKVLEGTTSGILIYGQAKGLVTEAELIEQGVDLKALEQFRDHIKAAQGLDLAKARGKEMRAYLEMHQEVAALIATVRRQWGASHPLLRGFEEAYYGGDLDSDQIHYLYTIESTIKNYLYALRH